jgi:hypothetical protein
VTGFERKRLGKQQPSVLIVKCGGRKIEGANSRASLWTNSELAREENALSKWREQGAQYIESAGSKIHSKIDDMRYEIKDNRKEHTQRKKQNTSNYRN